MTFYVVVDCFHLVRCEKSVEGCKFLLETENRHQGTWGSRNYKIHQKFYRIKWLISETNYQL